MSRRRTLTEDETALWRRVARSATPIRPEAGIAVAADADAPETAPAPPPLVEIARPRAPQPPSAPEAPARTTPPRPPATTVRPAPDPFEDLAAAPPRLDRRRFERLRRGRMEPEARLDLHGLRQDQAHARLARFVLDAQARGLRLVLVITGKGREDRSDAVIPERTGVLRHAVPRWLTAPPLTGRVIETRPAHVRHGGGGALYLYLRRRAPHG
jgi:DNA-nicking Smr family endonuclease